MSDTRIPVLPTFSKTKTRGKYDASSMSTDALLVLGVLASGPATIEHISMRLSLIRARVQHIMDELVEKGLVEQRQRYYVERVETYYVLKNENYSLVLGDDVQGYQVAAGIPIIIGSLQRNMVGVFKQGIQDIVATLLLVQADLNRESARQFKNELSKLLERYKMYEDRCEAPDGRYALVLAFYPIVEETKP